MGGIVCVVWWCILGVMGAIGSGVGEGTERAE